MEERHIRTAPFEKRMVRGDYGRRALALPNPLTYLSTHSNAPMNSRNTTLNDLDATPEEKKGSMIAAEIWGIAPVRHDDDDSISPLMQLAHSGSQGNGDIYEARLGRIGVIGSDTAHNEISLEEGGWTPIHVSDGKPVMQGGKYKYIEGTGLIYEDCDSQYDDLPNALLKALDFEKNGTPKERPHKLGAGPLIDLDEWRLEYTHFFH